MTAPIILPFEGGNIIYLEDNTIIGHRYTLQQTGRGFLEDLRRIGVIDTIKRFSAQNGDIDLNEFLRIIDCESGFNPTIINQKYGSGSGIGLGQLTAVAIKDCEKNLGKKIDPYNLEDNLECSLWLYKKYGNKPWGCPTCNYGSWLCWK